MGDKSMPRTHASNIVRDVGLQPRGIVGVLMTSMFEYIDCALYTKLVSQSKPDVTHQN